MSTDTAATEEIQPKPSPVDVDEEDDATAEAAPTAPVELKAAARKKRGRPAAKVVDPLEEEMHAMATAPQRKREEEARREQEEGRKHQMELEEMRLAAQAKIEKNRADARLKAERTHIEREKLRLEHAKLNARAVKTTAESQGARAAADVEETPEAREDALYKINLFRERMKVPGTGKRITVDTPLPMLLAELQVCNMQCNLERAEDLPKTFFIETARAVEVAAAHYVDFRGTADDFNDCLDAGADAAPGTLEYQLNRAMQQCSITYSHLFSVRPEIFLMGTFVKMAKSRAAQNKRTTYEGAAAAVPDDLRAQVNAYMAD